MSKLGPNGIERRQHPRVRFCAEALVSEAGNPLGPVSIQDISVGGALLVGSAKAATGAKIQVTITSSELAGWSFHAEVRWTVARSGATVMGVQILQAPTAFANRVQDVVIQELQRASWKPDAHGAEHPE
jgi:hypothetical protein